MLRLELLAIAALGLVGASCSDKGGGGGTSGGFVALTNVRAQQRLDATKLVDVHYDLDSSEGTATSVRLFISQDGGFSFPLQPASAYGELGEGLGKGEDKLIVWDPSIDLPGVSGPDFVARIVVNDDRRGDSPSFSLSTAAPGALSGTVRDAATGAPVPAAALSIVGGPNTTSNALGAYLLPNVAPGHQTMRISAPGFVTASLPVIVAGSSTRNTDVSLSLHGPARIVEVRGTWCGPETRTYYIDKVALQETFIATIEWGTHTPGEVHWITPHATTPQKATSGVAKQSFDMGADFGPGGTLRVLAKSGDAPPVTVDSYTVNFKVVSLPPPFDVLPTLPPPLGFLGLSAVKSAVPLEYKTPPGGFFLGEFTAATGANAIPAEVPAVGGGEASTVISFTAEGGFTGDGRGAAKFEFGGPGKGPKPSKYLKTEVQLNVDGGVDWLYSDVDGIDYWSVSGNLFVGAKATFAVPPAPFYFPVPLPFPPLFVPCYLRGEASIGVAAGVEFVGWDASAAPVLNGALKLDPAPGIEVAVGVGVYGLISVEAFFGGHLRWVFRFPAPLPPAPPVEMKVFMKGGYGFTFLLWKGQLGLIAWECDFNNPPCPAPTFGPSFDAVIVEALPRDYLEPRERYAVFSANEPEAASASGRGTVETVLQSNVAGQSTPALAALGDDLLAVWVHDDPTRTPTNRAELVWSFYDAASERWSAPAAVADDGTSDFHPALAVAPSGRASLVWENVNAVLAEPIDPTDPLQQRAKFDELRSKMDVFSATFDPKTRTWSGQVPLVANSVLDASPRIAFGSDGSAMATWVSNPTDHPVGTFAEPNELHAARFDGASWTAPVLVARGVSSVLKCALAHRGTDGLLLYSSDLDDDLATPEDRELFAVEYVGGSWRAPFRMTFDSVEDAGPQVAYEGAGRPRVAWYRGGQIVSASSLLLSDLETIVEGTGSENSGLADFRMASSFGGDIGIVWQDASVDVVDLWYASYDAGSPLAAWSKRQRLTQDPPLAQTHSLEYAAVPVLAANGDLVVAYDRAAVTPEVQFVQSGGELVPVTVPVRGQVDLVVATHVRSGDLAVRPEDVVLSKPNPLAGEVTRILATVRNQGDAVASQIAVEFRAGQTVIGTATIPGPLVGGDSEAVAVDWLVPPSTAPHRIAIEVDPLHLQEDGDRSNNVAVLQGVMRPDVTVDPLTVQSFGATRRIVARVLNRGALDVSDVGVAIRRESPTGPLLDSLVVPGPIAPGAFVDVAVDWVPSGKGANPEEIFATVDEARAITEFDEGNNTATIRVWTSK